MSAAYTCKLSFVDCMGYYDLAAELINCVFTSIVFYRSIVNYREILAEKNMRDDYEFQKSITRKLRVNQLAIVFMAVFLLEIMFSMVLFQMVSENRDYVILHRLNFWYKFGEIVCVNLLNSLILTVGFLYWKSLRGFYQISYWKIPCRYSLCAKSVFIISYFLNAGLVLACLVALLATSSRNKDDMNLIIIINVISTLVSGAACIASRILYYHYILQSVRMNSQTIRREQLYSAVIIVCSTLRIVIYVLEMFGLDYNTYLRSYNDYCHDVYPYHGLILLVLTFFANLLPVYVFTRIFTSAGHKAFTYNQKTLRSANTSEYDSLYR